MKKLCKEIIVYGIVQGVGFRPYIYKLALDNNLKGIVSNNNEGVYISIEGSKENIQSFIDNIKVKAPPISKITEIKIVNTDYKGYKDFKIIESVNNKKNITLISPDTATCDKCIEDINNKDNRRYKYPFTNCTNCGPRFSIIKSIPYDRDTTTMGIFKLCDKCEEEYTNTLDRRFHAQPNACQDCGPKLELISNEGSVLSYGDDIIEKTIELIKYGKILAVKGIGGFHLVCDGKNKEAINLLRKRKNRPKKPLALMMKDIETVKKYCFVNEKEEELLTGSKKPILILKKKNNILPYEIAFNDKTLGVMLPYSPLHYLLFNSEIDVLIMTSANLSGEPMIYKNKEAVDKLSGIVDYFLMHNRDIHIPIDDSVARVILNEETVIRLGRGYGPLSLNVKGIGERISLGTYLKNTIAVSKGDYIFISPYIGDMSNVNTEESFKNIVNHIKDIYEINEPKSIVVDSHPDFDFSKLFKYKLKEKIKVQHHHSHIVSTMVENNIKDKVIGIAFDGTGYGEDKNIWGGEFLICDYGEFVRVGHFNYFNLPGGESSINDVSKIALSLLKNTFKENIENYISEDLKNKNYKIILNMIDKNINSPLCCSVGRLFDGISGLIGFKDKVTYEGEAAIYLENISNENEEGFYDYEINEENKTYIVVTEKIIKGIIKDLQDGINISVIAAKFHNSISNIVLNMSLKIRAKSNINTVALSGGVFQNELLLVKTYNKLKEERFEVIRNRIIPTNDSGVSLGQLVISKYKNK